MIFAPLRNCSVAHNVFQSKADQPKQRGTFHSNRDSFISAAGNVNFFHEEHGQRLLETSTSKNILKFRGSYVARCVSFAEKVSGNRAANEVFLSFSLPFTIIAKVINVD